MAGRGRANGRRGRPGAAAVAALPEARGRPPLLRLLPSLASVAAGALLAAAALAGYVAARETSLFAVRDIEVRGGSAGVAGDAHAALTGVAGRSLLELDLADLRRRVEAVPTIAAATFDRAFPNTLVVAVVPERPVAVARTGADSWLVSDRGRVLAGLPRGARPALPRLWLGRDAAAEPGGFLRGRARDAIRAVAPLAGSRSPLRVASVAATKGRLDLKLRSGLEVRLGNPSEIALKLAVATRVLVELQGDEAYLDVAVPERPVVGASLDSQVEVETQVPEDSTSP